MMSLTVPERSWLHALPAGLKLALLCVVTLFLFPLANVPISLAASLVMIGLYLSVSLRFAKIGFARIRPFLWLLLIIFLYHVITARALEGLGITLKLLALVGLANLVTMSSRLDDMMAVAQWLLTPLSRFGLSPRIFGFATGLVIRFTPLFLQRGKVLGDAWRARCNKKNTTRLIVPLALGALDDADRVADALRARGGLLEPDKFRQDQTR